jgi:hypothetical protein
MQPHAGSARNTFPFQIPGTPGRILRAPKMFPLCKIHPETNSCGPVDWPLMSKPQAGQKHCWSTGRRARPFATNTMPSRSIEGRGNAALNEKRGKFLEHKATSLGGRASRVLEAWGVGKDCLRTDGQPAFLTDALVARPQPQLLTATMLLTH